MFPVFAFAQRPVDLIRAKLLDNTDSTVLVAAHRADWRNAPANSIEAMESAIAMGVDILEIDVRRTSDGVLILMHNPTLSRTTNGFGFISMTPYSRISKLRLRDKDGNLTNCRVPLLEDALRCAKGRVMLNLDKAFSYVDEVLRIAAETGTLDHLILKGKGSPEDVLKALGEYRDSVIYMPMVSLNDNMCIRRTLDAYIGIGAPVYEFSLRSDVPGEVMASMDLVRAESRIWLNPLSEKKSAMHGDETSLTDEEGGYGYLIDNLGAGVLQTDRPKELIDYLSKRNRH